MMDTQQLYVTYKPLLFSIAYRMLGTVADAEDIVQDTFLSLERFQKKNVENIKAWLCKTLTNRCIDFLRSARKKREVYVGPWLPEPVVFRDEQLGPMEQVIRQDQLSIAMLALMESLSPVERAIFILREVLDFDYDEIAEITGKETVNCRKIFSRVKQKLSKELPDKRIDYEQQRMLLESFLQAIHTEDSATLLELLSPDVVLYSDGGGKVKAALRPILSSERVVAFLLGVTRKQSTDYRVEIANVNGEAGIIAYEGNEVYGINTIKLVDGKIAAVYIIRNPDKLKNV
ncbi:RNA polymerase sigma-70 factor [Brevibacillus borstelensis]|jgi:RNA polymerase sigma-70 factor (ECF subfamily)|uniref:RNA polymerase sigma-70 factor n=2 Tax=Brevibacillus borstelensis TaxID=45462 RepID=UPI000A897F31|nr:RNA polymerase sigma-70 factor [Brevibacillus borstelensis]MCM3560299.1 RNA polymerase sigma-70 factor [Brevibacillus borstelensis]MCM3625051.1 RNA polymerase sigma-70 factor [Brevibacillus borstelensis]